MRTFLVAGNWKMNTTSASAQGLAEGVAREFPGEVGGVEIVVCPPFPYLQLVREAIAGSAVTLGAQNVYCEPPGAFTGEVAVEMLADVGCQWVIVGHSERRHVLGETDELINRKVQAALAGGLHVILCVGELLAEREAEQTEAILDRQLGGGLEGIDAEQMAGVVIAYEPVWAIGTGKTATTDQAESAHAHLRNGLAVRYNSEVARGTRILYGGSVKPDNAAALVGQTNVDGALVGGASLSVDSFVPIARAAIDVAAAR